MGLFLAALAVLAGCSLWILAFWERQKANPDQKIPHFSSPPSSDGLAVVYLVLGGAMLGGAIGYLGFHPGVGFLVMTLAVFPYPVLIYRHNRQIAQRSPASA